jgi:hypothetical protein
VDYAGEGVLGSAVGPENSKKVFGVNNSSSWRVSHFA